MRIRTKSESIVILLTVALLMSQNAVSVFASENPKGEIRHFQQGNDDKSEDGESDDDDSDDDDEEDDDDDSQSDNSEDTIIVYPDPDDQYDDSEEENEEDEDDEEDEDVEEDEDEKDIPFLKMTDYSGAISNNSVLVCGNMYKFDVPFVVENYMVSDKKVIKIMKDGRIKPKKEGTAMIVAVDCEGAMASCYVSVEKPKMKALNVKNGQRFDIMDMVTDSYEAYPSEVLIDKPSLVEFDQDTGMVEAKKKGRTNVTIAFGARRYRKVLKIR